MRKKNNLEGNTFKDQPERINRKGRPRRSRAAKDVNVYLQNLGCAMLSNAEFVEIHKRLFACTTAQLRAIKTDPNAPHELRLFVTGLLNPKLFLEYYKLHLNRVYGRPVLPIISERRPPIKPEDTTTDQAALLDDFDTWMANVQTEVQSHQLKP